MKKHVALSLIILLAAGLAHLPLFLPSPIWLRAAATLFLCGLLPGLLLVEWLVGRGDHAPGLGERLVLSVGAGYSSMVIVTLLLSYLPGGLTRTQTLLAFDLLIIALLALVILTGRNHIQQFTIHHSPFTIQARGWLIAGILSLGLIGGFFRFVNLDYSEFQGDEARLALHAAELIQGYDHLLFVHKKGPTEILLPTLVYAQSERLNEVTARLPFSLANFVALFAIFLLGWRLFGPLAGWVAAVLLALDGYLVAFGRVVQYQSIVFLMDVLVVLIFVRLVQQPKALTRYMTLAALLLATGLLSHYEAALVLFPVLFLLWQIKEQGTLYLQIVRAALLSIVVGGAILALFYLPFVLDPAFEDTYYYLTDYRMGNGSVFNHLAEFFARTTVYSSTYYLLLLILLTMIGLSALYWRRLSGVWRWVWLLGAWAGLLITFWSPGWLKLGELELTWLFFALALAPAWLLPSAPWAERTAWLWFGGPMVLALFFTAIPNTHVYSFFIPWALLAGLVVQRGWLWLRSQTGERPARWIAAPLAAACILIFGFYEYWLFVYNEVEVLRTWPENRPRGYWVNYEMPVEVAIFGFPNRNGWKTVAGLYKEGVLEGNYDTNARDVIAEWYTRGDHYCAGDDLRYFMLTTPVEPARADEYAELRNSVENQYKLWGQVMINGRPGLSIYEMTDTPPTPQELSVEPYATRFDKKFAGPRFERTGPISKAAITNPLNYRFGDTIWLKGYKVEMGEVEPGDVLEVTLYWETTARVGQDYKIFVQLIDLSDRGKVGQSDSEPGCNRAETSTWLPGDTISDRHRVAVDPNAQPGPYTVLIGAYIGDKRLPIFTEAGEPIGDQLELTSVGVVPDATS
jgi:hypothetical protein